jgi:hypothetical protein
MANSVLRDYDDSFGFDTKSTVTGIYTSDADTLVVQCRMDAYGGFSGISYESASLTRVAYYGSSYNEGYVSVWHLPNCPKSGSGTLSFSGGGGYLMSTNIAVCKGCQYAHDGRGEVTFGNAYTAHYMYTYNALAGDLMFCGQSGGARDSPSDTVLYTYGNLYYQYKSCAAGNNYISINRGQFSGNTWAAACLFTEVISFVPKATFFF